MSTRPAVGFSMPEAIRSSVVLPLPDGPSRHTTSAGAISSENPLRAWEAANCRSTRSNVSRAAIVPAARPAAGREAPSAVSGRLRQMKSVKLTNKLSGEYRRHGASHAEAAVLLYHNC